MKKKPLVKNAANKKQVQSAADKEKRGRKQELEDLHWLLSDPRGRRLLWRYLSLCGVFQLSFTGNSSTFFNEGRRDIGLHILADVTEARPEAYLEMVNEANKEKDND